MDYTHIALYGHWSADAAEQSMPICDTATNTEPPRRALVDGG